MLWYFQISSIKHRKVGKANLEKDIWLSSLNHRSSKTGQKFWPETLLFDEQEMRLNKNKISPESAFLPLKLGDESNITIFLTWCLNITIGANTTISNVDVMTSCKGKYRNK